MSEKPCSHAERKSNLTSIIDKAIGMSDDPAVTAKIMKVKERMHREMAAKDKMNN